VRDDHRRAGQQAVAVGVVAVQMGVDQVADRQARRCLLDGVEQGTGAFCGGAGVDDDGVVVGDDESRSTFAVETDSGNR
jgi:hypothetical protein